MNARRVPTPGYVLHFQNAIPLVKTIRFDSIRMQESAGHKIHTAFAERAIPVMKKASETERYGEIKTLTGLQSGNVRSARYSLLVSFPLQPCLTLDPTEQNIRVSKRNCVGLGHQSHRCNNHIITRPLSDSTSSPHCKSADHHFQRRSVLDHFIFLSV